MEAKLVVVNKGWAVVSKNWTTFGESQEEAISKFEAIAAEHMELISSEKAEFSSNL